MKSKVALVTGASSGIGKVTAEQLAYAGYRVFGTSRRALRTEARSFEPVVLDVTSDSSVAAAVQEVMQRAGRIDVLVNNAGIGITGAAEESSIEQVRALFETNFHGVVRMTNAILPVMREQRNGRILNVGSAMGLIPGPYLAYYSATKHALEGYSQSLDHEVRQFGIRVAIIGPAYTSTSFEESTVPSDSPVSVYADSRAKHLVAYRRAMVVADKAESVAKTIVRALQDSPPRLRYASGKSAKQIAFARRFLPSWLFDKILRSQFGLD